MKAIQTCRYEWPVLIIATLQMYSTVFQAHPIDFAIVPLLITFLLCPSLLMRECARVSFALGSKAPQMT